jgi:hypothetical protein
MVLKSGKHLYRDVWHRLSQYLRNNCLLFSLKGMNEKVRGGLPGNIHRKPFGFSMHWRDNDDNGR